MCCTMMPLGAIRVLKGVIHVDDQALHSTACSIFSLRYSTSLIRVTAPQVHMLSQLPIVIFPAKSAAAFCVKGSETN